MFGSTRGVAKTLLSEVLNMDILKGYKTYIAAVGLVGLAVWQFSQGQVELGVQSLLAALAAFGLRRALADS